MKERIWELDALRGLGILAMVIVHTLYDLIELFQVVHLENSFFYDFCIEWGGVLFLVLSGICVTLSQHYVKRGLWVLLCGFVCTLVTLGAVLLGPADPSLIIYFGVLHCLGVCMLSWHLFSSLPRWGLGLTAAVLIALGLLAVPRISLQSPWLLALGFHPASFASSDYFPLLPNLGYFLAGAFLGKTLYREKKTLFPKVNPRNPLIRFFDFWGRHSLAVYLFHQPVLVALVIIILLLK